MHSLGHKTGSKLVGKPQSEPDSALFQTHIEVDLLDGKDEFKNISQSDVDPDNIR